ncbi:hypothetical protein ATOP_19560 [Granulimonas faecalis]|uniref:Uncharacterized protein n=1 Tax=Granulimonas faecalis TaxID=2894155 RepID=A0AAV5B407_9ACTN|nr:hypothetical protein ATOP_19560 [Granulimonas faecalis]
MAATTTAAMATFKALLPFERGRAPLTAPTRTAGAGRALRRLTASSRR